MGSGEKKVAVVLVVVLVALIGVYVMLPKLGAPKHEAAMAPGMASANPGAGGPGGTAAAGTDSNCATDTAGGQSVPTQEFGKPGAKVEVIALLPITHGCHTTTEAELKKIQKQHPADVHLTIVDLFGPDAPKYLQKVGGGQRTLVAINGKTSFSLNGRQVTLERQEGMSYQPSDLAPIIEEQLKKA
jgi:hypothetical protein